MGGDDLPDQAMLVVLAAHAEPDIVVGWEERLSDLDTERLVLGRADTAVSLRAGRAH